MDNIKFKMCNISELLVDKDYSICYRCYLYYETNDPKILKDLEEGSIVKVEKNTLITDSEHYITIITIDTKNFIIFNFHNYLQSIKW